jgi:hypothetical protein
VTVVDIFRPDSAHDTLRLMMNWDGMGKMMLERSVVVLLLLVSLVSAVEIDVVKKTINFTFLQNLAYKA